MFYRFNYLQSHILTKLASCVLVLLLVSPLAIARTWTSANGKRTFVGELQVYNPKTGKVTVTIDGVEGTFYEGILSTADIAHLKKLGAFRKDTPAAETPSPTAKKDTPKPSTGQDTQNLVATKLVLPDKAAELIDSYCIDCHEDGTEKGDVRLDNLTDLTLDGWIDMLNRVQEQVYLDQMPPKKKDQPSSVERSQMVAWLSKELKKLGASRFEEKLRYPAYGNVVDHKKLFSGEIKDAASTPARRWLISPEIFDQRVMDIFELQGRDRNQHMYGATNPLILPDSTGVRYYDNEVLDGGHLLVMLTNAEWISSKQIRPARVKNGEIKPDEFSDIQDRWSPRETPAEFEKIILQKNEPSKDEIEDAIRKQFYLVLRREPNDEELSKYHNLTQFSIKLAGNSEGLRQMLVSVILESEFLYRLEFGEGNTDSHGRKMLSPREGAYAISYALSDMAPDAELLKAVKDEKLNSAKDYKREVTRLLENKEFSRPKLLRFFRDFFGYPLAVKAFKDAERVGGIYQNPDRGTFGTPGHLVNEADRMVSYQLDKDQNVFENILTTDDFFVYHDKSNEEGKEVIKQWKEVWEKLKDTDWDKKPKEVYEKHKEFLATKPLFQVPENAHLVREFRGYMLFFRDSFGQGRTPFTTISIAHGYYLNHSPLYSLLPSPQRGIYVNAADPKVNGAPGVEFWDYPVEQPFKIKNRKGILTHPAWLMAHSKNTHNDPVVRGKWVREKLLAGRVPDVPITVDAQIPEDHSKTLRDRLEKVTLAPECWKCHEAMNPVGLPFEIYDDFGRFRMEESLEAPENIIGKEGRMNVYKSLKVDPSGFLSGTEDPKLDGKVISALDMIGRLAKSKRVQQSIIRHAFRFYMGRNETLSDSKTLIDANQAYEVSGGSFNAVVLSLLTSDSFIYRK